MSVDPIVILSAVRTPIAAMQGELAALEGHELGSIAIAEAVKRAGVDGGDVQEVVMGCVLQAGQGQAPARIATIKAGLPASAAAVAVNKVCGSGMKAVLSITDSLALGHIDMGVAGGMESMTNAPYLMKKARGGYRIGHDKIYDHMMLDGLENAYDGQSMGLLGELCADKYQFTREAQDKFAIASVERAQRAQADGSFSDEIVPITVSTRAGDVVVDTDEQPRRSKVDKIPQLRPAFKKDGTVTAATSSSISDGAAALVLTRASVAKKKGLKPIARIVAQAGHAQAPEWFTTAPVTAIEKVLKKAGWKASDVDLFEINEAFAVVTMAAMKELGLPHEKVNVNGGACAVGHPIGATGARIVVTLLHALEKRGLKRGVASLCIGGGEALAIAVERD